MQVKHMLSAVDLNKTFVDTTRVVCEKRKPYESIGEIGIFIACLQLTCPGSAVTSTPEK